MCNCDMSVGYLCDTHAAERESYMSSKSAKKLDMAQNNTLEQDTLNVLAETRETICDILDRLGVQERELARLLNDSRLARHAVAERVLADSIWGTRP